MLSVILPTFNEAQNSYLKEIIKCYSKFNEIELIAVDAGSTDKTVELLEEAGWTVLKTDIQSRGARIDKGIKLSSGDMILLQHPRSILRAEAIIALRSSTKLKWGGFTHKFDNSGLLYKFTSWYSNTVRADLRSIFYLDHCIFASKKLLVKVSGTGGASIFEDTVLCCKLRRITKGKRLAHDSKTSAVRFEKNGFLKQSLLNAALKLGMMIGIPPSILNRLYEKGTNLNGES